MRIFAVNLTRGIGQIDAEGHLPDITDRQLDAYRHVSVLPDASRLRGVDFGWHRSESSRHN